MSPKVPVRVTAERRKVLALDTNIFIYHFEENPVYSSYTEELFERIESGRVRAITSALTLHEILTGARKAGKPDLVSLYRNLLGSFPNLYFVPFDANVADISSDLRARYGLRTPDAIQVATAIHQRADAFVTNDEGLRRIKEIKITLPRAAG
jgi:predicted nucleic acid-binding protein